MNEDDLFGKFRVSPEYKAELAKIVDSEGHAHRERAMDLIRKYYLDNPLSPKKPFSNELRNRVAKLLGLESPEDLKRLKFYTSVGKKEDSPLDFWHGIDSWIEYTPKDKKEPIVVTIDGTIREKKDDAKADLLVKDVPDKSIDANKFAVMVDVFAQRAAELFGAEKEEKPPTVKTLLSGGVVRRRRVGE
ncbi:hypothetical protein A2318_04120 [Candidatus Uhrbacteria bacterium RIFOXYB2_FULL_45_11]|uniref:Uncharacterized protein n=1 Tax=Candidatus Uhrbacteria bacterium RIFOXYB2_FULL_45_11 TaxID=1802421 RepID=A0A1F7W2C9_9BACT|nr:MAG: hypothetical protein A2318_04120 [Candidatus Uhrbacteria bacterium RIFOXYB2_FULL_45_11]